MEEERVFSFGNTQEAGLFVQRRMEKKDLVLVKGSRGIATDRVVDRLRAEFS